MKRLRIGVIYGGRSNEHEVSLASAASIFDQLNIEHYEPVPLFIDKAGSWRIPNQFPTTKSAGTLIEQFRNNDPPEKIISSEAILMPCPTPETVLTIARDSSVQGKSVDRAVVRGFSLDVVFPIVHGSYGEDGTLQGLLELANIPYVGASVLSSALAMDKTMAKVHFAAHGLPLVRHMVISAKDFEQNQDGVINTLELKLGYPVFVKPANQGSSVGVSKATDKNTLRSALATAWNFDDKLLVEVAVENPREIECSVLGNETPEVSILGEVIPAGEFYDYEAKYLDDRSELIIPAKLTKIQTQRIQSMAVTAYQALDCSGLA
ncbi:MAG TPA: D-alanine--D-alanine ligase, partial [Acidobacteria bacterium]|nr:D-alanine--D-alanine ligase [Acidobacteriota bacterium]